MYRVRFENGKTVRIANLTPHPVDLLIFDKVVNIPVFDIEEGKKFVLRIAERIKEIGYKNGIRLIKKELDDSKITYEDVGVLKDVAKEHDFIIVSLPCKELLLKMYMDGLLERDEIERFYIIGSTVRDEQGRVLYADSLAPIL